MTAFGESQLQEWCSFANELADEARIIANRYFRKHFSQETKSDNSPVTIADKEIEAALRTRIEKHYPTHAIHGEETGITNEAAELRWVIDPIDGTRAFIAGIPTFVTLIALVHHRTPIIGIIDQPYLQERWVGCTGKPTLFNNETIALPSTPTSLTECIIGTTSPDLFPARERAMYDTLSSKCASSVMGGDGYLYGRMASGAIGVVIEHGLKPHDFCALVPVVEGDGGRITDYTGKRLTLDSKGDVLAAANEALHAEALKLLSQLP